MKSRCEICREEVEGSLYVCYLDGRNKHICEECLRKKVHRATIGDIKSYQEYAKKNRKDRRAESET